MTSNFSEHEQAAAAQQPRVRLVRSDRAMPFPEYRLLGLVGQGQFAQVYCAIHKQTGQLVAIKQTRHPSEQPSQEPFVLNELCHPNIVCAQAMSLREDAANAQTKADYQFVLDYCEAGTLRSQLDLAAQSVVLSPPALTHIAIDILKGLTYIHSHQVIHGDLKPENILLTYQASGAEEKTSRLMARISDFGSARFVDMPSQSRKEIGSPTYAAPERFDGQSSYASDLYSAGVILYELLLGDRPFSGSPDYLRQAHQTHEVPFPQSLSSASRQFLSQALYKQPEGRFSSAAEMLRAFQSLCESDSILKESGHTIAASEPQHSVDKHSESLSAVSFSAQQQLTLQTISTSFDHHSEKIHQLIATPKGQFVITNSAVYWLNSHNVLKRVFQLSQPSWIAISPKGDSLIAMPKVQPKSQEITGQFISFQLSSQSDMGAVSRLITFSGKFSDSVDANTVQLLSVDEHYTIRVLTSSNAEKSHIECFTRKGTFIASLPINLSLSCAVLASDAYQIAALSPPTPAKKAKLLLISLRPFQIHTVAVQTADLHLLNPQGIGVFSWGFALIDENGCLFLDRLARRVGRLDMKDIVAIAPFSDHEVLIAIAAKNAPQPKNDSPEKTSSSKPSGLFVVDLNALNLDLIF